MKQILIVEDDITYSLMLSSFLKKQHFDVTCQGNVTNAKKSIEQNQYDLILSDLRLPDEDGISLLEWIKKNNPSLPLIMMTGYADIQTAVQAIKSGASDYISKPVNPDELLRKITETLLSKQTEKTEKQPETKNGDFQYIEGKDDKSKQLYDYVRLVAPTNMSVLIKGASGTGKEHIAHLIHKLSSRKNEPFIAIDCGAIPRELAASEFFGHIKGSFTGAISDKTGAFTAANKGTLFLDEVGNLPYDIQIQLLRALQEREIKAIGSNQVIHVDIRLVTATNENLEQAIENGTFREDLYHRINEFSLQIPELKDRKEDIMLFANLFLDQANRDLNKLIVGFDNETSAKFLQYSWPGNLRQMKNVVKRATLLCNESFISLKNLPSEFSETEEKNTETPLFDTGKEETLIREALQKTGNNKSKAAQLLCIDRKTLYNKLKHYNIQ